MPEEESNSLTTEAEVVPISLKPDFASWEAAVRGETVLRVILAATLVIVGLLAFWLQS